MLINPLVGLERCRSFLTAVHGIRCVSVPAHVRRCDRSIGSRRCSPCEPDRPQHLIVDQGPEFKCEHFGVGTRVKGIQL